MENNGNKVKDLASRTKRRRAAPFDRLASRLSSKTWYPIALMTFGMLVDSLGQVGVIQSGSSVLAFWLRVATMALGLLMAVYGIMLWGTSICHFHLPHDHDGGPGDKRDTM
ncbi:MAG: hypothetical protein ACYDB0_00580 [Acidithiobacillus sp.]